MKLRQAKKIAKQVGGFRQLDGICFHMLEKGQYGRWRWRYERAWVRLMRYRRRYSARGEPMWMVMERELVKNLEDEISAEIDQEIIKELTESLCHSER